MTNAYLADIKDSPEQFLELKNKAIQSCRGRVPVPFSPEKTYLLCYQDGRFMGFANSESDAQEVAREWIWEWGEGHVEHSRFSKGWGVNHFYYLVLLRPGTSWSKKYLAGREDWTPFEEYSGFCANDFYDAEYISEVDYLKKKEDAEAVRRALKEREDDASSFWMGLVAVAVVIFLLVAFS